MKQRILSLGLALALCLSLSLPSQAAQTGHFTDVPATHWSYSYVEKAYSDGAVSGMGDGRFDPQGSLTSAHFITILVNALYPDLLHQLLYDNSFTTWYGAPWAAAEIYNLLDHTSVTDPEAPLTRYDMAAILYNIMSLEGLTDLVNDAALEYAAGQITDFASVPDRYQQQVSTVYALGILSGMENGSFSGDQTMTRAQAAVVYCKMIQAFYGQEDNGSDKQPPTDNSGSQTPSDNSGSQTSPSTSPAQSNLSAYQEEVLRLVNLERAKEGISPLSLHQTLCSSAQIRAEELPDLFSHTRPDGSDCFTALEQAGLSNYRAVGENIAAGQSSPAEVVDAWMNSEGHRANIMNPDFTELGVGYVYTDSGYSHYWVQMFMG